MASMIKRKGKNGGAYYAVYPLNGRRKWKRLSKLHAVSKKMFKELEHQLEMGDYEETIRENKPIPISQFAKERYLPWVETRRARKSYSTAKNSFVNLLRFFKDTPLSAIDGKMIEDYIKQRKDKVKPRTVNIELTYLGAMFNRAIAEKYFFKENPVRKVEKLKVPKRHPRFLSNEEMQRLWEAATPWVRIFITVSAYSGMRSGEISNMQWRDIDWVRNVIKVPITKTGREREIPMDPVLKKTLLTMEELLVGAKENVR